MGDLIAEADIKLLKQHNINLITPVLICDGIENKIMTVNEGMVKAGKIAVLTVEDAEIEEPEQNSSSNENTDIKSKKKKHSLNFDFLQKLGKVLMVVIAVMPAAGLMISLGQAYCNGRRRYTACYDYRKYYGEYRLGNNQ